MLSEIGQWISNSLFLLFVAGIPLIGVIKGIKVYDSFIEGAKSGLQVTLSILPHLVAILVGIGMFRAAGGFTWLSHLLAPFLTWMGVPVELMPLAIMRPFSGAGSNGLLLELIDQQGADSLLAKMGATLMGSSETTFYVLAIYFGAVGIKRTRYAIPVGLLADFTGLVASVWVCRWIFG